MKIAENDDNSAKIDLCINRACSFNPPYYFLSLTFPITLKLRNLILKEP